MKLVELPTSSNTLKLPRAVVNIDNINLLIVNQSCIKCKSTQGIEIDKTSYHGVTIRIKYTCKHCNFTNVFHSDTFEFKKRYTINKLEKVAAFSSSQTYPQYERQYAITGVKPLFKHTIITAGVKDIAPVVNKLTDKKLFEKHKAVCDEIWSLMLVVFQL